MAATGPSKSRSRARERRLEVERLLAERGLLHGPRRILQGGRRRPPAKAEIHDLRGVLEELGPVFAAFGRYLSLRADLIPATDCLVLQDLGEEALPSPLEAVDVRLLEELGRPRTEAFPVFEQVPFQVRWLDQSHRARLEGGERVVVRVIHPGRAQEIESDLEALSALQGSFAPLPGDAFSGSGFSSPEHVAEVLADFRRLVSSRLDLEVEADALQVLGRDARRSDLLVVPEVYRDLSTSGVLTMQWLPGQTLDEIASLPGLQEIDAHDVARRVGLSWLQMALVGHRFPIEADLQELPDGRLAVIGGTFAELPDATRIRLWNYLRATVEHFPDRAAANLLREVSKLETDANEGELRTRVRQVVPFRDGAWSTTGESLGEYAVLHWRLLRATGFRARPHLDSFFQGLFWAARTVRRFAPQKDPLGEAVRDFDWLAGWNQLRQLTAPRQVGATAESYLSALVELPQKIDRILSATEDGFRLPPTKRHRHATLRRHNATAVVVCLCLAMAAVALLADDWRLLADDWRLLGTTVGLSAVWAERILATVFFGLGLVMLRTIWRSR